VNEKINEIKRSWVRSPPPWQQKRINKMCSYELGLKSGLVGFGPDVQGTLSGFTIILTVKHPHSDSWQQPVDSLTVLPIYLIVT
jgi:hypothetical protein